MNKKRRYQVAAVINKLAILVDELYQLSCDEEEQLSNLLEVQPFSDVTQEVRGNVEELERISEALDVLIDELEAII